VESVDLVMDEDDSPEIIIINPLSIGYISG